MTDDTNIQDAGGLRIYLQPAGFLYGGKGLPVAGAALRALAVRAVVRDMSAPGSRLTDTLVPYDDLRAFRETLPSGLGPVFDAQLARMTAARSPLVFDTANDRGDAVSMPFTRARIMGVLNVTPDSFSDGGKFVDVDRAVAHARAMAAAGADIIDVGGESTRPGATPVWEGEEAARVIPVIARLVADGLTVSVDTRHAEVMRQALTAGVHILNDVSALTHDPDSLAVAAGSDAPVVLMHAKGTPADMQDAPAYDDVLLDVFDALDTHVRRVEAAGIERSRLILDPGLGFGKRVVRDNVALLAGAALFHSLGCPLLVGASRKRFIGALTGVDEAGDRLAGSLAAAQAAALAGVQIVRVHDVAETRQALSLAQALADGAQMDMAGMDAWRPGR